jgi:hypothetical protein
MERNMSVSITERVAAPHGSDRQVARGFCVSSLISSLSHVRSAATKTKIEATSAKPTVKAEAPALSLLPGQTVAHDAIDDRAPVHLCVANSCSCSRWCSKAIPEEGSLSGEG